MSFISTVEKIDDKVVLYKYDGEGLAPNSGDESELETPNQKRLCFLDVETTGKDRTGDEIIEIALKTILFDMASCSIASVKESYESYNEPTIPIKEEAFLVNRITDEMIMGQSIDWNQVDRILEKADVIVAHNASFDRAFIDEHSSVSPRKIWACSLEDIDWPGRNFSNGKQELLCFWHGFYYESHRAMNDVNALIHLVTHSSYTEGHPILELIENSGKPYYKMKAIRSPFEKKDTLKANNYKWDGGNKYWWKKLNFDEIETEKDWLTEVIYDDYFPGVVEEIPLTDKYKQ